MLGLVASFKESLGYASLNIVIFHVKVPSHASKIQTPDIKGGDHGSIDYDALLKLNIKIARWSQPDANIIIFTDYESFKGLPEDEKVTVIRSARARPEGRLALVVPPGSSMKHRVHQ